MCENVRTKIGTISWSGFKFNSALKSSMLSTSILSDRWGLSSNSILILWGRHTYYYYYVGCPHFRLEAKWRRQRGNIKKNTSVTGDNFTALVTLCLASKKCGKRCTICKWKFLYSRISYFCLSSIFVNII